ncbi:MAG TPA: glucose-1-phosphate adenylyltransferase [Verrucomicrobia bacterium]|nr:MAG: glucose-1-phosphate adenylyltransferase [Lentisphaerae bacterium GWF2_57_35]HBA83254.1 glucose-1-phosphate adenylyltransferase [Verrucomicrobiota bacterium]
MNVVSVIMGGGQGKRLQPLTRDRAKPAVPIGGKYRLVDIPISNCINSGIRRIYLLTQFNSVSLHQHVQSTYRFDQFNSGFVRILAAQQTPGSELWYQGTADAVRQNYRYLMDEEPDLVVVLSGDQLYRMNFADVVHQHIEKGADVTICTKPVERSEAGALGIMQVDANKRITKFVEKPGTGPALDEYRASLYKDERFMASMGIYVFNKKVLEKLLDNEFSDFGKDIIPASISQTKVFSYGFEGYWKDIGTVRAFWEANLALTDRVPEFNFYDTKAPIYTRMRYLPPSKINCCDLNRCLLCEGCIISGHRILHSIVGVRAIVGDGSVIEHTVLMGSDFMEKSAPPPGIPHLGVGRDCFIKNAIIDKNARIGDGAYITPDGKPEGTTTELFSVQEGVIVIPKNTVIPAGMRI